MENNQLETAIFAGGCFWCTEYAFDLVAGVETVTSGYTGGNWPDPTYEEVSSGRTGHVEAVQILYDPSKVSYPELLMHFWHSIDPTTNEGQFCDIGTQYRPVIFYHDDKQKEIAEKSKDELIQKGMKVVVDILPAQDFFQPKITIKKFYKKSPERYHSYHGNSGPKTRLKKLWE